MRYLLVALIAFSVLLGCARSTSVTEVLPDGSWKRKLTLVLGKGSGSDTIDKIFVTPKGGWKVQTRETDDEYRIIAERQFKLGETSTGDLQILSKGKVILVNEVSVKEVDGKYRYSETLTWKGKRPKEFDTPSPELLKVLDAMLPKEIVAADKEAIVLRLQNDLYRALFGPSDPILLQFVMQPDLAEHRIRQRLGKSVMTALEERLGDKLTHEQRRTIAAKLMNIDQMNSVFDPKKKSEGEKMDETSQFVAMAIVVSMPGTIVSSNGEIDPITNEVFWSMLPEGAALGPVTLEALSEKK